MFVLDSTDPAQVKAFESKVDLANTVFIVSSKSGTTLEPNIFKQYFFDRVEKTLGAGKAGSRFIAITDPGSKFEQVAQADGFRHIFHGDPSIGGRYSALSDFGMVPAAVMGMDALRFLDRADVMAIACSSCLPVDKNPGVQLGLVLGVAAKAGRDKVTLITSPGIWDFGAWLEQLLAESTGKDGKGLIPVDARGTGRAGSVRQRSRVRIHSPGRWRRSGAGRSGGCAGDSRAPGDPHRAVGYLQPGSGDVPLGDRDGGGGFGDRHQRVQSAGRGSEQDRDAGS